MSPDLRDIKVALNRDVHLPDSKNVLPQGTRGRLTGAHEMKRDSTGGIYFTVLIRIKDGNNRFSRVVSVPSDAVTTI